MPVDNSKACAYLACQSYVFAQDNSNPNLTLEKCGSHGCSNVLHYLCAKTGSASKKGQRALGEYVEVTEKKKSLVERKKLFQGAMTARVVEDNKTCNKG